MNNLDKHRKEIDKIDDSIIELLEQRFNLVVEIGQYKKEHNLPIYDSKREEELINNLLNKIDNNELKENYKKIIQLILIESKNQQ